MLATARAASVNPRAAQSASLNTSAAIQRYNMGDVNGARSAAIQALIEANRLPQTNIPVLRSTIPQTSYLQTQPFPIAGGSVAAIDANAFVAQARGAVAACQARSSPNTTAASQQLASAERDAKAGRYQDVRVEARAAVDLCAAAQQQLNNQRIAVTRSSDRRSFVEHPDDRRTTSESFRGRRWRSRSPRARAAG